jgi:hypothetical protein
MITIDRRGLRIGLAAAALALLGPNPLCRAQFDDEDEAPPAPAAARPAFVVNARQFNVWVFASADAPPRERFEAALTILLEEAEVVCGLTEAQVAKLRLAGLGDITRFRDRVDAKRRELQDKSYDQDRANEVLQKVQPLRLAFQAGLFGDGSLFGRTLEGMLDEGQARRYAAGLLQRAVFAYLAKVDLAVASWARSMGLTADQRQRLTWLILAETRAPRRLGQQEQLVVPYQVSKIDQDKLRPLFDDKQWPIFDRVLNQGRQMERALLDSGYLPADEEVEKAKTSDRKD